MEDILALYASDYNPKRPLLCFDERPCQLIDNILQTIAMKEGSVKKEDYQYKKCGTCCLLVAYDIHLGKRYVWVCAQRRRIEWAKFHQYLIFQYPEAEKLVLI